MSISGVPPFNGFFSKELVYDAALDRGAVFYLAAVIGSFFTAASFLKLGHAAFFGKIHEDHKQVREASWAMTVPMMILALICILFGLFNYLPIRVIQGLIPSAAASRSFGGWPASTALVLLTVLALTLAVIVHWFNAWKKGSGLKASDYLHYAPGFKQAYDAAEKKWFDPYDVGMIVVDQASKLLWAADRAVDWVYGSLSVSIAYMFSHGVRKAQSGSTAQYLVWALAGAAVVICVMFLR